MNTQPMFTVHMGINMRKTINIILLCMVLIVLMSGCDNTRNGEYKDNPVVTTVYYDTALRPEPSSWDVLIRIPHDTNMPVLSYKSHEGKIWYQVLYKEYQGYLPQEMVSVVSEGNGMLVLPEYDEYAYAGKPAGEEKIAENQKYIDLFTGIWYCDKETSANNMNIEMTISLDNGRMMYLRDMGNGEFGGSVSDFATPIPTTNSINAEFIKATLIVEDGVLYESFSNGRTNMYVRSDGSDYSDTEVPYSYSNHQSSELPSNPVPAMTKEEAARLEGTGYGGTRPNSSAENDKLKAAQVKCKTCGMHSDNGRNSQCDYCRAKYGGS